MKTSQILLITFSVVGIVAVVAFIVNSKSSDQPDLPPIDVIDPEAAAAADKAAAAKLAAEKAAAEKAAAEKAAAEKAAADKAAADKAAAEKAAAKLAAEAAAEAALTPGEKAFKIHTTKGANGLFLTTIGGKKLKMSATESKEKTYNTNDYTLTNTDIKPVATLVATPVVPPVVTGKNIRVSKTGFTGDNVNTVNTISDVNAYKNITSSSKLNIPEPVLLVTIDGTHSKYFMEYDNTLQNTSFARQTNNPQNYFDDSSSSSGIIEGYWSKEDTINTGTSSSVVTKSVVTKRMDGGFAQDWTLIPTDCICAFKPKQNLDVTEYKTELNQTFSINSSNLMYGDTRVPLVEKDYVHYLTNKSTTELQTGIKEIVLDDLDNYGESLLVTNNDTRVSIQNGKDNGYKVKFVVTNGLINGLIGTNGKSFLIGTNGKSFLIGENGRKFLIGENGSVFRVGTLSDNSV